MHSWVVKLNWINRNVGLLYYHEERSIRHWSIFSFPCLDISHRHLVVRVLIALLGDVNHCCGTDEVTEWNLMHPPTRRAEVARSIHVCARMNYHLELISLSPVNTQKETKILLTSPSNSNKFISCKFQQDVFMYFPLLHLTLYSVSGDLANVQTVQTEDDKC